MVYLNLIQSCLLLSPAVSENRFKPPHAGASARTAGPEHRPPVWSAKGPTAAPGWLIRPARPSAQGPDPLRRPFPLHSKAVPNRGATSAVPTSEPRKRRRRRGHPQPIPALKRPTVRAAKPPPDSEWFGRISKSRPATVWHEPPIQTVILSDSTVQSGALSLNSQGGFWPIRSCSGQPPGHPVAGVLGRACPESRSWDPRGKLWTAGQCRAEVGMGKRPFERAEDSVSRAEFRAFEGSLVGFRPGLWRGAMQSSQGGKSAMNR
jgi:hypothetical protein